MRRNFIFALVLGLNIFSITNVFADCKFVFVNNSEHPVTLQGFFLGGGESQTNAGWITVAAGENAEQLRVGGKCDGIYQHTGQMITKISLKNNSGYWLGNKGFLFVADRSYSTYALSRALADDGAEITLSNGAKMTPTIFKVFICDGTTNSDECN